MLSAQAPPEYSGYGGSHSHSNDLDFTEELELLRPFGTYTVISNDMEDYFEGPEPMPRTCALPPKLNYQILDTADVRHLPPSGKRFPETSAAFNHTVSVHTGGREPVNWQETSSL